jgi:HlyD family secretion protein
MRRLIRWILIIVVVGGIVYGASQAMRARQAARADQQTAKAVEDSTVVQKGELQVTVTGTGPISPLRQVSLSFEISAPVREVLVKEGQAVKAGDVLARLDTSDLENSLTNAQIALEQQKVAYDALTAPARPEDIAVAKAALAAAQASASAAFPDAQANDVAIAKLQADIARNQLYQQQLQRDLSSRSPDIVPSNLKQADTQVQLADVNVNKLEKTGPDIAALSSANAQIVSAQRQLDRLLNGPTDLQKQIAQAQINVAQSSLDQAQATLSKGVLVAPFDGVVSDSKLVVGEIPPQGAAMQLIDNSSFIVDVAVDETDIVNLKLDQPVSFRLDALPDADIKGKVTRIAVTPVKSGQLVTYTVRVTLDPTKAPVRAGMTSTATVVVNELKDVARVPNRFIRIDRATQKAYVTVQRADGGFQETEVKLGLRNETDSQILSGVDAGQTIVLVPRSTFNPIG